MTTDLKKGVGDALVLDVTEDASPVKLWNRIEKRMWIGALFCGCSMLYAARTVMPLCIMSISKEMGWDKAQSGSVLSAFFWGYTMTQVLGGYLSDRIGGEIVITTAAVGWSLLTFWTPWIMDFYSDKTMVLYIAVFSRVIMGCFQGPHGPAIISVHSQKIELPERSFSLSLISCGSATGTLLCGSIGSLLLEQFGWHSTFYAIGIFSMVWLLFLRYYLIAKQRRKALILSVKEMTGPPAAKEKQSVPWLTLFSRPAFWAMILAHFCHTWAFHFLLSWLPTYFEENFRGARGWVFNVVPWLVTIPSTIIGGWLADYLIARGISVTAVRKLLATVALGGVGFFLLIMTQITTYESALTCMAIAISCCGFHGGAILVNPQDIAPKYSGSVFGIMNMAGAIPGFVGVYIAGHILEITKSWAAVFTQTACVCIFGWVVYTILGSGKKIV